MNILMMNWNYINSLKYQFSNLTNIFSKITKMWITNYLQKVTFTGIELYLL